VKSVALQVPAGSSWQFSPLAGTPATELNPPSQRGNLCSAGTITSAGVVPRDFSPARGLDVTSPVQAISRPVSLLEMSISELLGACCMAALNNMVEV